MATKLSETQMAIYKHLCHTPTLKPWTVDEPQYFVAMGLYLS
jgi:hypothetical protein